MKERAGSRNYSKTVTYIKNLEELINFFGRENIAGSPFSYLLEDEYKEIFEKVQKVFRFQTSSYYLGLGNIQDPNCPILRQILPARNEIQDPYFSEPDPLKEEKYSPFPNLTHKYPDRVLWYISHHCATYCRFCMRKRKVSKPESNFFLHNYRDILDYISGHREIKEVILSGGDPLSISDKLLYKLIEDLKKIKHLYSIRIHTRMLATNPYRITKKFAMLGRIFYPLTVVTHFNHPVELTPLVYKKVRLLRLSGYAILNQSVLLKGVNDDPAVMEELLLKLIKFGIKPYYLHQCDEVQGVSHFHVSVEKGKEIMKFIHSRNPGITIPVYVKDLPDGNGKVPFYYHHYVV